jgi:hypothetical protein
LWRNRQTEAHLILRSKPRNCHGNFESQICKQELLVLRPKLENSPPPWFWGSTEKPTTGFEAKLGETVITSFEVKLEKTVATSFEAKPVKTVAAGFEAKPLETIITGFEAKPLETITTGFEAKPLETITAGFKVKSLTNRRHRFWGQTNEKPSKWFWGQTTDKLSTLVLRLNQETRTPSLHMPGVDRTQRQPTSRPQDHRVPDLYDHPRSSAPDLLLLPWSSSLQAMPHLPPAHHETSERDSPSETKIKEKQNEVVPNSNSNLTKSMTHHNQTKQPTTWFINLNAVVLNSNSNITKSMTHHNQTKELTTWFINLNPTRVSTSSYRLKAYSK